MNRDAHRRRMSISNDPKTQADLATFSKKYHKHIDKLVNMGFPRQRCIVALYKLRDMNEAVAWLSENAAVHDGQDMPPISPLITVRKSQLTDYQLANGDWVEAKVVDIRSTLNGKEALVKYETSDLGPSITDWVHVTSSRLAPLGKFTTPSAPLPKTVSRAPASEKGESKKHEVSFPQPDALEVGMFLDCRDSVGKWLEAEIKAISGNKVKVHFIRWDPKWDETVDSDAEFHRFAEFHHFSAADTSAPKFEVSQWVYVNPPKPIARSTQWIMGQVRKVDGSQSQVQYEVEGRKYQYWFHTHSHEIMRESEKQAPAPAPEPAEEPVAEPEPVAGQPPAESDEESADQVKAGLLNHFQDDSDEESDGEEYEHKDEQGNTMWWKNQFVEVRDTVNKWLPAEVLKVRKEKIFIHYEGWHSKWDEWLNLSTDGHRIRKLGADLGETVEEKERRLEEEDFREQLRKERGFEIVDCEKDGNCLFRSFAHQIYGDPERHAQLRKDCYDYLEREREHFEVFIAEDFDAYVKRQRQLNEWGDHVEIYVLREMFNKNVEIYDKDSVKAPRPIGLSEEDKLPVVRLSYHGGNHYNSVVNPATPPPLGDGSDSPVNIRELRLKQNAEEKQRHGSDPDPVPTLHRGRSNTLSMLRPKDESVQITDKDFMTAWTKVVGAAGVSIPLDDCEKLVSAVANIIFERRRMTLSALQAESLTKAYDDIHPKDFTKPFRVKAVGGKVTRSTACSLIVEVIAKEIGWALSKGE